MSRNNILKALSGSTWVKIKKFCSPPISAINKFIFNYCTPVWTPGPKWTDTNAHCLTRYLSPKGSSIIPYWLVGLKKQVDGFNSIFIMVDRTICWAEAVPVANTSAATCIKVLANHWISCFGVPSVLTSDLYTVHLFHLGWGLHKILF